MKLFYWPFQGGASFVDPLCYLCFTFVLIIPSCLFLVVACWEGTCLLCVVFPRVLSLSHMVSPVRCGTWLIQFLIFVIFFSFGIYVIDIFLSHLIFDCRETPRYFVESIFSREWPWSLLVKLIGRNLWHCIYHDGRTWANLVPILLLLRERVGSVLHHSLNGFPNW